MKIVLPQHTECGVVSLRVDTPVKEISMRVATAYHPTIEIDLPDGVHPNEVEVYAQFMDGNRPVDKEFVHVERVTEPEPEDKPELEPEDKPDEAVVEAVEEVAQSTPAEEVVEVDEEEVVDEDEDEDKDEDEDEEYSWKYEDEEEDEDGC